MWTSHIVAAVVAFAAASQAQSQAQPWAQCGGTGYSGPTTCVSGYTCVVSNEWYSQCVQGSSSGGGGTDPGTGGGGNEGGGGSGGNSCGSASVDQLVGFGAGTTGGGSGAGTTVTSCSALQTAIAKGGVINISGTLSGCGSMRLVSGTTIKGVGSNSGLVGSGFRLVKISNVIIRNLKMRQSPAGADLIDIEESTRIWVDHNELSNDGITGDKDYYDGLLDIKRAADQITVSWNTFSDHWKGSLIGHSDSNGSQDSGKLRVTYHHNYWNNVNSRTPSIRFGTAHIYSSCYENIPASGINSRMGAQVLVEQSSFTNVKRAIVTNLDSSQDGFATQRGNVFVNSDTTITGGSSFSPSYAYTTDPASCVCTLLKAQAGTGNF
ncbi:pectin lyase-like protein [Sarocladium strictum]